VSPSLSVTARGGDIKCFEIGIFSEFWNKQLFFLVDTGSVLSVLPRSYLPNCNKSLFSLVAANGSVVDTFGLKKLDIRLDGFDSIFSWEFTVAEVTRPILGADFLSHFGFLVNCAKKCLQRSTTVSSIDFVLDEANFKDFVCEKFPNVLSRSKDFVSVIPVSHAITTIPGAPVSTRRRELSQERRLAAEKEFAELESSGIVRRSFSPWASAIHIVPKKDGSLRICGDYRRLNKVTIKDAYPMPLLPDLIQRFANCQVFSKLDLAKAYHQIPMDEDSIAKTAVTTPFGLFEYLRMPFGLCNAAQTFQRFIHMVLAGLDFVAVYIDDLVIASVDVESHRGHLMEVLKRLNENNLQIKLTKCFLFQTSVDFLGHEISISGIRPLPIRIKAIQEFPKPQNVTELRSFLGTVNFCRRFIPHLSDRVASLTSLATGKKKAKIVWTTDLDVDFLKIKDSLVNIVTLAFPDGVLPLTLTCDASKIAIGAVLTQNRSDVIEPIEFFSHKLSAAQINYSTFDRELLGIFLSIKHFQHLLIGRSFTIFTDHKPLIYALDMKDPSPRQQRQISYISQFDLVIKFIAGADNVVADCFSRIDIGNLEFEALFNKELLRVNIPSDSDLKLFSVSPTLRDGIYFDNERSGCARPVLGLKLRNQAFLAMHNGTHAGFKATYALLQNRVVWPFMRKDIKNWCKACLVCQANKVTRHIKPPILQFPTGSRFDTVHIDIVGPLPVCQGYMYMLTMVDRCTRWPEAFPLRTITAQMVAKLFIENWIARFGVPKRVITDQGKQFESQLFAEILKKLGTQRLRTTAYHPQSNGLVERFHRTLKSSLRCLSTTGDWVSALPLVLLGWRNIPSSRTGLSPAQLVFGSNTVLVNDVFFNDEPVLERHEEVVREHFKKLDTIPVHRGFPVFVPKDLKDAKFVWLLREVTKSLQSRYLGPYKVIALREANNTMTILVNGAHRVVNWCKVKPATFLDDADGILIGLLDEQVVDVYKEEKLKVDGFKEKKVKVVGLNKEKVKKVTFSKIVKIAGSNVVYRL